MNEREIDIKNIVAKVLDCPVSELSLESRAGKTEGWDSLAHLNIFVGLGEKFSFEPNAELLAAHQSVSELVEFILSI